jgi:hypothetical protein
MYHTQQDILHTSSIQTRGRDSQDFRDTLFLNVIQKHKNHRYMHKIFSPVCLFMYGNARTESLSLQVISITTIIETEFELEVRKRTKTDNVCGSACRHAMLGKITAQEGECARYKPLKISESVSFAESCACNRSSAKFPPRHCAPLWAQRQSRSL